MGKSLGDSLNGKVAQVTGLMRDVRRDGIVSEKESWIKMGDVVL